MSQGHQISKCFCYTRQPLHFLMISLPVSSSSDELVFDSNIDNSILKRNGRQLGEGSKSHTLPVNVHEFSTAATSKLSASKAASSVSCSHERSSSVSSSSGRCLSTSWSICFTLETIVCRARKSAFTTEGSFRWSKGVQFVHKLLMVWRYNWCSCQYIVDCKSLMLV